jgi:hypothetical protein
MECFISVAHMEWCATEFLISVAHVLVRHRMLIFVAKILWSITHAPQNTYIGAPQMRFSLLVGAPFFQKKNPQYSK